MQDRRTDPRLDTRFSLRNLLRVRSRRQGLALAVLSTPAGMLMAGSREDRPAERTAAHVADALFSRGGASGRRFQRLGQRTGACVSGLSFAAAGGDLCLAVIGEGDVSPGVLEGLANRVQAIMSEPRP